MRGFTKRPHRGPEAERGSVGKIELLQPILADPHKLDRTTAGTVGEQALANIPAPRNCILSERELSFEWQLARAICLFIEGRRCDGTSGTSHEMAIQGPSIGCFRVRGKLQYGIHRSDSSSHHRSAVRSSDGIAWRRREKASWHFLVRLEGLLSCAELTPMQGLTICVMCCYATHLDYGTTGLRRPDAGITCPSLGVVHTVMNPLDGAVDPILTIQGVVSAPLTGTNTAEFQETRRGRNQPIQGNFDPGSAGSGACFLP